MEIDCFQKKLTVQDGLQSRDMVLACPGFSCSGDQAAAHLLPEVPSVWARLTAGSRLWVEANENAGHVTMHVPILQHNFLVLNSLSANHHEGPANPPR